jgi:hypothetical protein
MNVKWVQTKEELKEIDARKSANNSKEIVSRKPRNISLEIVSRKSSDISREIGLRKKETICRTLVMPRFTIEERNYAKHLEQVEIRSFFIKWYKKKVYHIRILNSKFSTNFS